MDGIIAVTNLPLVFDQLDEAMTRRGYEIRGIDLAMFHISDDLGGTQRNEAPCERAFMQSQ